MINGALFVLIICASGSSLTCHPVYFYSLSACESAANHLVAARRLLHASCHALGTKKKVPNVHS